MLHLGEPVSICMDLCFVMVAVPERNSAEINQQGYKDLQLKLVYCIKEYRKHERVVRDAENSG